MVVTDVQTTGPQGVADVYREHRLALLRLAFLLTGSREHAEDVVQAVFTGAVPRWDRIDNPLAYLRGAVVRRAHDLHRRRLRDRLFLLRGGMRGGAERPTEIPEVDEAWAHIGRLPPRQRAVVVLHYYEDLALVEIARLLDHPAATVRSDLRRALDRLRKVLT